MKLSTPPTPLVLIHAYLSLTLIWHPNLSLSRVTGGRADFIGSSDRVQGQHYPVYVTFNDTILENGWSQLDVVGSEDFPATTVAYAAGYGEGFITAHRISQHLNNIQKNVVLSPLVQNHIKENTLWIQHMIAVHANYDPYWHHIGLLYRQLNGLYDGFVAATKVKAEINMVPTFEMIYALTLVGDVEDLCSKYGDCSTAAEGNTNQETTSKPWRRVGDGHCSVLVKLLGGPSRADDILIGHNTWVGYEFMLRVYKRYDLPYRKSKTSREIVPGRIMTFTSYFGVLYSADDFYQISSNMVVTETTIVNENKDLWTHVQPRNSVLCWARNMLANRLSNSGSEWVTHYSYYNSGTYNNQYMILDYKKFKPGGATSSASPGLFTVLEQMPGTIYFEDLTSTLFEQSYWPSYNRPFFDKIKKISNQTGVEEAFGEHYNYHKTARAQLFKALHGSVVDEASMQRVMRHNNFENDEVGTQGCLAGRSGSNAIAERGDLTKLAAGCIDDITFIDEGAIDAKFTNVKLMQTLSTRAISGPTSDQQPPFSWSSCPFERSHEGQPETFDFPWVVISWRQVSKEDTQ